MFTRTRNALIACKQFFIRIRSVCVVAAVAVGATTLGVGTADATGPLTGTKIRTYQTGWVLGVTNNVGGSSVLYQFDTDDLSQKWAVGPVSTTTFLLRNLSSDMCITAVTGAAGEALQQRPCDPRWDEQVFSLEDSSRTNRYLVKNQAFGKCLNPSTGAVNTTATLVACASNITNGYTQHSFDVR
ncbi:RICIN domain-containing protein [Kitasatospora sp. NPDC051984]|uniref:RICIN domain-containing protein n=1 Tax=Kitasatospora sp. NPDC051984 TaxID=3364059 RepID=UPI0037C817F9